LSIVCFVLIKFTNDSWSFEHQQEHGIDISSSHNRVK